MILPFAIHDKPPGDAPMLAAEPESPKWRQQLDLSLGLTAATRILRNVAPKHPNQAHLARLLVLVVLYPSLRTNPTVSQITELLEDKLPEDVTS